MKTILYILPLNLISNLIGKLASIDKPRILSKLAVRIFAKHYKINTEEALKPFNEFNSVSEFFRRELKPDVRTAESDLVSPVDATLRIAGDTKDSKFLVKGIGFTLEQLLGESRFTERLANGSYFNFYLAPYNYHRIHVPVTGKLIHTYHIPGKLFPVNDYGFNLYPDLFNLNERVISYFESNYGLVAVVAVGALNVGKITVPHLNLSTNKIIQKKQSYDYQADFNIMDELAIFELGSSVVVLTEKAVRYSGTLNRSIKLGNSLI